MNLRFVRNQIIRVIETTKFVWWILFALVLMLTMLIRFSNLEWLSSYKTEVNILIMVVFMAAAFTTNFTNKITTLTAHAILYWLLSAMVQDPKLYKDLGINVETIGLSLIIAFCIYLILITNTISVAFQFSRMTKPNTDTKFEHLRNYLNLLLIAVLYILLVIFTVTLFAVIYKNFIAVGSGIEGLIYSATDGENPIRLESWDPLYFSSTTFFTVGFGDIIPRGYITKYVVQAEMLAGHIINIALPALIFNLIVSRILNEKR